MKAAKHTIKYREAKRLDRYLRWARCSCGERFKWTTDRFELRDSIDRHHDLVGV